ncbi:MAG: hypothetical protein IPN70_03330 [Candidatus Moraniibacteriota bacterium]|nr:MAG: hypothetical protein IPN70_03330 [Candidatus Moranbacteria bacterium]
MSGLKNSLFPVLGVFFSKGITYLFVRQKESKTKFLLKGELNKGDGFSLLEKDLVIIDLEEKEEDISLCRDFRCFNVSGRTLRFALTYISLASGRAELRIAHSMDMIHWKTVSILPYIHSPGALIYIKESNQYILYHGKNSLSSSFSFDLRTFETKGVASSLPPMSTKNTLRVADVKRVPEGLLVLYFAYSETELFQAKNCAIYGVLFDRKLPEKILWQSEEPLWVVSDRHAELRDPISLVFLDDEHIISYWRGMDNKLYAFQHWIGAKQKKSLKRKELKETVHKEISLPLENPQPLIQRHIENPILLPKNENEWETKAAFNPTALCDDEGRVHIVYRAIGEGDVSVLGYALSYDGVTIFEREEKPMYVPRTVHEGLCENVLKMSDSLFSPYSSGGGAWGGCEDPKLTRIEDTVYMTYVAYNGWGPPRIALTSIPMEDFLNRNWENWKYPILISPPGKVAKSAAILPEKINGKYVVFYRIFPDVLVDFVDSLDDFDGENTFLQNIHQISPREGFWDAGKFSFGAAPIRTSEGWLVIYHAVTGRQEWPGSDLRYKIGAMLLDLEHPERVICRSSRPILEPDLDYENGGWKAGVIYPCGAIVREDILYVYYGGADTVTCVASAPLQEFLKILLQYGDPELTLIEETF